ncbi:MAG: 50S ribosomal protein L33 [Planctomycetes bacterium]|nr:50S ribosomal protein L33 [Planctomycetota bacterium]
MAKSKAREYVWLQCGDCGALNYRTNVRTQGGVPKLSLKKYCPRQRKHTLHKLKRK